MTRRNGKPCKKCGTMAWYSNSTCKQCMKDRNATPEMRAYQKTQIAKDAKRAYAKTPKAKANQKPNKARRKTRKTKAGGSFTAKEWRLLCNQYNNRCAKCGSSDATLAADHVISVKNGGTSNIDNIQPLCQSCNSSKGARNTDYRSGGFVRWIQKKLF